MRSIRSQTRPTPAIQFNLLRSNFLPKGLMRTVGKVPFQFLTMVRLMLAQAQDALRAGFTSNNPFDRLGLFGMGFNISTWKLGRRTLFRTGRREEADMVEITVDLESMVRTRTYDVPGPNAIEEPAKLPRHAGAGIRLVATGKSKSRVRCKARETRGGRN